MDSQMKKGVLEMCLMQIIASRETYGYELMNDIGAAFPDVNESTVYAILRRLQNEANVTSYIGDNSGGPARKYFRLTDSGRLALDKAIDDWHNLTEAVRSFDIL